MGRVIRDNSIGEALSTLGTGLIGNPKKEWEAAALKQRMEAQALNMLDTQRQHQSQDALISQFDQMLTPEMLGIKPTVPGRLPGEGEMGPFPDTPNPMLNGLDKRLAFGRAAAANAVRSGAGIGDVYKGLGLGTVIGGGLPTNEQGARTVQTFLDGSIPDARVPLTEGQRVLLNEEEARGKLKQAVPVPKEGSVYLSPEQGGAMGVKPNEQGQFVLQGPGAAGLNGTQGRFAGTGKDQQLYNTLLEYERAREMGPVHPELERAANLAWTMLFGSRQEVRSGEGGRLDSVTITPDVPQGFNRPGAMGRPAGVAPQAAPAQPQGTAPQMVAPGQPAQFPLPQLQQSPTGLPAQNAQVQTIRPGHPKNLTEGQDKTVGFLGRIREGDAGLTEIEDRGGVPGGFQRSLSDPRGDPLLGLPDYIDRPLRETITTDDAKRHRSETEKFISGVLRKESGAVIGTPEYKAAEEMFIPKSSDPPDLVQSKRAARRIAAEMMEAGLLGGEPAQIVAAIRARVEQARGDARRASPGPQGGARPGGKDYSDVDAIVGLKPRRN